MLRSWRKDPLRSRQLGEAERAKEWINRAMLIDPDNVNARYNFACALACYLGETDAALTLLRPLLRITQRVLRAPRESRSRSRFAA